MADGIEIPTEPSASSEDALLIKRLSGLLLEQRVFLSTAESCTGGGIGHWLTSQPGSSDWYSGGFITYSNRAKVRDLEVKQESFDKFGAVSEEVAKQMASGCAHKTDSRLAIAVTGIAGPGGGTTRKPVGTICFGWTLNGKIHTETIVFSGDRTMIRNQTIRHALIVATKIMEEFSLQG